jgi:hypothetical protein
MLQATRTLDIYTLRSSGANRQSMTFGPDADIRIGPYAGWKWFFMGYTFSLNNMGFSNDRQEFDFSVYSSQIGIDLFFNRIKAFTHITSLAQKAPGSSKRRRGVMLVT